MSVHLRVKFNPRSQWDLDTQVTDRHPVFLGIGDQVAFAEIDHASGQGQSHRAAGQPGRGGPLIFTPDRHVGATGAGQIFYVTGGEFELRA